MESTVNTRTDCKSCLSHLRFRTILSIIVGAFIGTAGLLVVKDPPATILLKDRKAHIEETKMVIQKLNHIELLVTDLKTDVLKIKTQLVQK